MKAKWIIIVLIIALSFIGLVWYLGLYGFIVSLLWSLLVLIITNLDRADDIIASSYKIGRTVSFWFEKNAVEKRLEVTIGSASKKVNQEVGIDLLPHGVDIKWDEPHKRDAFIKRGKIVVCLEPSQNEERNLARATILYVQEDLIAPSQRFINTTITKSLCFAVARKMLMLDRKLHALRCLNKEFIEPEAEKMPQIREYVSGMDSIDKKGYLTRILLREFSQLDAKLSPALTDPQARKETKALTRLLIDIAEKEEEKQVPLTFIGSVFRIGIMPIAKIGKDFHISSVVKTASYHYAQNLDTVYVVALGLKAGLAKLAVSEIEKAKLYLKHTDWEYDIVGLKKGQLRSYVAQLSKV
jgi:hypothetical protein